MKKFILLCMVLSIMLPQRAFAANDWAKEMIKVVDISIGEDIRIALIDTGISGISSDRIAEGKNYAIAGESTADTIGHGTAIAKIILDVAPQSTIIPLVYCSKSNDNKISKVDSQELANIIKEAVDVYKCRIINISSGTTENSQHLYEAIRYAEEKGVVVVSSIGNKNIESSQSLYFPAAYDTVIGVGAIRRDGKVASFSQRNDSVSICAPGDELVVLKPNGKYTLAYGTSYATAYVSAGASLLLSKQPLLKPYELREALYATALDLEEDGYDTKSGYGLVQIDSALEEITQSLSYEKLSILLRGKTILPVHFAVEALCEYSTMIFIGGNYFIKASIETVGSQLLIKYGEKLTEPSVEIFTIK